MAISLQEKHRILREAFRHYSELKAYRQFTYGKDYIEHKGITIYLWDLEYVLEHVDLSDRKMQAFVLNVLEDKKQKEVAEIMGITTVSVGQYVDAACRQLAELYFTRDEMDLQDEHLTKSRPL